MWRKKREDLIISSQGCTLHETKIAPGNDGWNTIFLLIYDGPFSGAILVSGSVPFMKLR